MDARLLARHHDPLLAVHPDLGGRGEALERGLRRTVRDALANVKVVRDLRVALLTDQQLVRVDHLLLPGARPNSEERVAFR